MWLALCWCIVFVIRGANMELFSAEENGRLPRLFHLDDYDRCLSQKNGLYCVGEFDLVPLKQPNDYYRFIKDYSSNPFTYNRSIIHRGYCVSSHCPSEANTTLRFERCVDKRSRLRSLSASLRTASCTTRRERIERAKRKPDEAQHLFLNVVYGLLLLNLIGTVYDLYGGDTKKNSLITAWSVRSSWRRLTAVYENGDQRLYDLEPINGMRVISLMTVLFAHACAFNYQFYVSNPHFLELLSYRKFGGVLANGTSMIQWFVMLSSFLTAYNLLLYAETHEINLYAMPMLIVKRVVRIFPVHLILVGYAATWWPHARDGPLIDTVIGSNSRTCRHKFWSHVFFVNNLVEPEENCMPPTWFIPVDMHLFILSCLLTLTMMKRRHLARGLFAKLTVISSLLCGVVVYFNGWKSMVYMARPQKARGIFDGEESFAYFYMSTWGSLPACFMGLYMAYLHYDLQQKKFDFTQLKWLKLLHNISVPLGVLWVIYSGRLVRQYESPLVMAINAVYDRPVVVLILAFYTFGMINFKGYQRDFFSWSGWRVLARLSLPIMLIHWIVNAVVAARPFAFESSWVILISDHYTTAVVSVALSLVLSLCVEIPVQKFMSLVLF